MAKQTQRPSTQQKPDTTPPIQEKPPKTEWIERAIRELALTPSNVREPGVNERLLNHILDNVGSEHREYFENGFSVAKSAALKRLGWTTETAGGGQTKHKPEETGEATLSDLMAVKALSNELKGGLGALTHALEVVDKALSAVGGSLPKLRKCLDAVKLFQG